MGRKWWSQNKDRVTEQPQATQEAQEGQKQSSSSIEKDVRLSELKNLESYLTAHGIGNDNPEQPMRMYVAARRRQIETEIK